MKDRYSFEEVMDVINSVRNTRKPITEIPLLLSQITSGSRNFVHKGQSKFLTDKELKKMRMKHEILYRLYK